jgi:hypothetical protein
MFFRWGRVFGPVSLSMGLTGGNDLCSAVPGLRGTRAFIQGAGDWRRQMGGGQFRNDGIGRKHGLILFQSFFQWTTGAGRVSSKICASHKKSGFSCQARRGGFI